MNDTTTFRTNDLDLAAYLDAKGHISFVVLGQSEQLATFHFRRSAALLNLVEQYVTGEAVVAVRVLLSARRRLFRAVRGTGGGRHD